MNETFYLKVLDEKNQEIQKLRTSLAAKGNLEKIITDLKKKIVDLEHELDRQTRLAVRNFKDKEFAWSKLAAQPELPEEPEEKLDILSEYLIKTGRGFLAAKKKPQ